MIKNPSRYDSPLYALAALFTATVTVTLGTSMAKQLFPIIGAQGTTALRIGFSALLLLLFWRPWRWSLSKVDAYTILCYGIPLGMMNLLFYLSIQTIPFGLAMAIEFMGPLAVSMYFSQRRTDYLWVVLAIIGLLLILPIPVLSTNAEPLDLMGILYALGAAIGWGMYIVFGKRAGHLRAGQTVSWGIFAASIFVVPIGVIHAGSSLLNPQVLLIGLCVALISSAIPMSLEMYALKRLPRETFGIMASLEPAVASLSAMVFLNEILDSKQWVAVCCVIAASIGSICTTNLKSSSKQLIKSPQTTVAD